MLRKQKFPASLEPESEQQMQNSRFYFGFYFYTNPQGLEIKSF